MYAPPQHLTSTDFPEEVRRFHLQSSATGTHRSWAPWEWERSSPCCGHRAERPDLEAAWSPRRRSGQNSSAGKEEGEDACCWLWATRSQSGTACLADEGGAGLGQPRAPQGPRGCQRLPPGSAPQGGRARTLVCASESSNPVAVTSRPARLATPGCLGPRGAGAGRRAARTVTGAPLGQWRGRCPSSRPRRARQSAAALRFKCAEGRGSPPRRQRPRRGRLRAAARRAGLPAPAPEHPRGSVCERVRARVSAAGAGPARGRLRALRRSFRRRL